MKKNKNRLYLAIRICIYTSMFFFIFFYTRKIIIESRKSEATSTAVQLLFLHFYRVNNKLPSCDEFHQNFNKKEVINDFSLRGVHYYYNPNGFKDNNNKVWYIIILDGNGYLYKINLQSKERDSTALLPQWVSKSLKPEYSPFWQKDN